MMYSLFVWERSNKFHYLGLNMLILLVIGTVIWFGWKLLWSMENESFFYIKFCVILSIFFAYFFYVIYNKINLVWFMFGVYEKTHIGICKPLNELGYFKRLIFAVVNYRYLNLPKKLLSSIRVYLNIWVNRVMWSMYICLVWEKFLKYIWKVAMVK